MMHNRQHKTSEDTCERLRKLSESGSCRKGRLYIFGDGDGAEGIPIDLRYLNGKLYSLNVPNIRHLRYQIATEPRIYLTVDEEIPKRCSKSAPASEEESGSVRRITIIGQARFLTGLREKLSTLEKLGICPEKRGDTIVVPEVLLLEITPESILQCVG